MILIDLFLLDSSVNLLLFVLFIVWIVQKTSSIYCVKKICFLISGFQSLKTKDSNIINVSSGFIAKVALPDRLQYFTLAL